MKEGESKKEHFSDLLNHPTPDSPAVHDGDDSFSQSWCQGKQLYAIWNENGPSWGWGTAHFPGWMISMQNYRGRKETIRHLVGYSSFLFFPEVSWMTAFQMLKQEQLCSVDIKKKKIMQWLGHIVPLDFAEICVQTIYLIPPAEENTSLPSNVTQERFWHDDQNRDVTEGRKLVAQFWREHTG